MQLYGQDAQAALEQAKEQGQEFVEDIQDVFSDDPEMQPVLAPTLTQRTAFAIFDANDDQRVSPEELKVFTLGAGAGLLVGVPGMWPTKMALTAAVLGLTFLRR